MINRVKFFEGYKREFGKLSQKQVNAIDFLLTKLDGSQRFERADEYAYILATVKHETAETYLPIKEYGRGAGRSYGRPKANGNVYYGRGYVQITWDYNYKKLGEILNVPLYEKPDLALVPDIAYDIMEHGMFYGFFTGKKLGDYVNENKSDYYNARRVINGTDKAELIKGYAEKFYNIIYFDN